MFGKFRRKQKEAPLPANERDIARLNTAAGRVFSLIVNDRTAEVPGLQATLKNGRVRLYQEDYREGYNGCELYRDAQGLLHVVKVQSHEGTEVDPESSRIRSAVDHTVDEGAPTLVSVERVLPTAAEPEVLSASFSPPLSEVACNNLAMDFEGMLKVARIGVAHVVGQ
jgi:hypothetical protein